ncbi:MAG: hypothetical protein Q7J34_03230 [Bacteroidales bacterium]|jgi:hypothetical protein|nr:hypothetical protein [Bacteroidales bacterium]
MNLASGLGGVVTTEKNIFIQGNVSEKITAARHANNSDVWVIIHERDNAVFKAYLVTTAGINLTPVQSIVGSIHESIGSYIGYMKTSPDGNYIACSVAPPGNFCELFSFNTSTALISNPIKFTQFIYGSIYGLDFSLNSRYLFFSTSELGIIYKADLLSGDSASIIACQIGVVTIGSKIGAIQLGLDANIYFSQENYPNLHAVICPETSACNSYIINYVPLGGNSTRMGLPNFFPGLLYTRPFTYENKCLWDSTFFFPIQTSGIDSVLWDFGDLLSGVQNTSSMINPWHIFTSAGSFIISLTYWINGISTIKQQIIQIHPLPQVELGSDTSLCGGNTVLLNAGLGFETYL